jgi:hypothetical protein
MFVHLGCDQCGEFDIASANCWLDDRPAHCFKCNRGDARLLDEANHPIEVDKSRITYLQRRMLLQGKKIDLLIPVTLNRSIA